MVNRCPAIGGVLALCLVLPAFAWCTEETTTIPAWTSLQVRLTTTLNTKTNQDGDPWTGQVIEPIFAKGQEVVPGNSTVEGHVTFVKPPGRAKGRGEMRLLLDFITTSDGVRFSTAARPEEVQGAEGTKVDDKEGTIQGPSSKKSDAKSVGIGAGVGAGVGAVTAGGKGSLYGAGIGAAAALVRGLLKRGKDLVLPQGAELTFTIPRDIPGSKPASSSGPTPRK